MRKSVSCKVLSLLVAIMLAAGLSPTLALAGDGLSAAAGGSIVGPRSANGEAVALESGEGLDEPLQAQAADGEAAAGRAAADGALSSSGLTTQEKPTLAELRAAYNALPEHPAISDMWAIAADVNAYSAGTLSKASLDYAQAYLGLIRLSANLGKVGYDAALNANAAQGALILAKLDNGLTHYPSTPPGVTDAQAAPGKYACSASNLSYSWGYYSPLRTALQGQMDDEDLSNLETLGHRRWLLNPATATMGIGSARSESGSVFTSVRVFNQAGLLDEYGSVDSSNSTSYDFVAWPASGAFLNNMFNVGVPWSVSLNPSKYRSPASTVKVVVTRLSDGASWTLDSADSEPTETGEYFKVENSGYGVRNCIIFNPGSANLGMEAYEGAYVVEITGLETIGGEAAALSYEVDFANSRVDLSEDGVEIGAIADATFTGREIRPDVSVAYNGAVLSAGEDYNLEYSANVHTGAATVTVSGIGAYKGTRTVTFNILQSDLAAYAGTTAQAAFGDLEPRAWYVGGDGTRNGYFPGTDTLYLDYTIKCGLMSGYSGDRAGRFGPNDKLSRAMAATIIYRMATGATAGTTDNSVGTRFSDVPAGQWYSAAVAWCANAGVVTGYSGTGRFDPDGDVTREQLAAMIFRYCRSEGMAAAGDASSFPDYAGISEWAREGVAFCSANSIVSGYSGSGAFGPADNAERCQMAKIIAVTARMME